MMSTNNQIHQKVLIYIITNYYYSAKKKDYKHMDQEFIELRLYHLIQ